ncbi:MAG TPA: hypothetical protein VM529_26115 [Gemmata sp.]|jgi:hypothetical protein|nr:hypothetical protein [Gemmata sp.]
MPRRKSEHLGEVTAPSGSLFVVDMGYLEMWCHDQKPVMPPGILSDEGTKNANAGADFRIDGRDAEKCGRHWGRQWHPRFHFDIPKHGIGHVRKGFAEFVAEHGYEAKLTMLRGRVTHRQRIADALEYGKGMGQVFFQGLEGFVISGVPTGTKMRVTGERMGGRDRAVSERWRWVDLEVRPGRKVVSSAPAGRVFVDRARLMFADIDALKEWKHDEPIDGKADLVFWGRDAEAAARAVKAPRLPDMDGGTLYGWDNLPDAEARRKGGIVWQAKQKNQWLLGLDYRPHSHHWQIMEQVRRRATESGIAEVGGATMCGFMTSWGDGLYPVIVERDRGDEVVRVRLQLGDDDRVKQYHDMMERAKAR